MADIQEEQTVNVYDPENDELGSIPHSQLDAALQQGLKPATPEQLASYSKSQKYGSTGQQLITGAEGAASAATLGASTGIERALGVPAEDIQGRREENPISHGVGQVAGLVGSSFVLPGGGAAGLMERAGAGAASALGLGAAEGAAAKIGSAAVKGAVENMMFQSGDEVSKMLASDPHQSVGSAAADVGLSGLLGGVVGGGIGGTGALWDATVGKKVANVLTDMSNETNHVVENGVFSVLPEGMNVKPGGLIEGASSHLPENYFDIKNLERIAGQEAPNASEAAEAFSRLGIEAPPWVLSDQDMVKRLADHLRKRGTFSGQKVNETFETIWNDMNKKGLHTLRDATLKTEAEAGRELKKGVTETLETELKPIEAKYKELEPHFKNMGVSDDLKLEGIDKIVNHPDALIDPAYESLAKKQADRIERITNVDELKRVRTLVNKELRQAYQAGSPEASILQETKNALTKMREDAIEQAAKATGIGAKDAASISSETIQEIRETDKAYRAYKEKLMSTGREAGIGKIGSARVLLEKLKGISDESFASKLFDMGDINQLNYFKEHFPKQFELARRYKLKDIFDKSIDTAQGGGNKFQVSKLLSQVHDAKMNPEARQLLFAGHTQDLADLQTVFGRIPKNYNPSGTAAELGLGEMFSLKGLANNAEDAIKYQIINRLPVLTKAAGTTDTKATMLGAMMFLKAGQPAEGSSFKAAVDSISKVLKGESAINKATSSVFKAGREVVPSKMLETKDVEKLDKKLKDLQVNVSPMFDVGSKLAHYMPDHGSALSETAMNAVNYLNSLRPKEDRAMPLDQKVSVSPMAKAQYERALSIAESPLQVLQDVKEGSVTPSDIITLRTLYPGLYARMGDKLNTAMMDHLSDDEPIPYKTKMGMSMFLGQPLDSTMTPAGLMAIQSTAMAQRQDQQQAMPQASKPKGSMKALDKYAQSSMTPDQARQAQKLKS